MNPFFSAAEKMKTGLQIVDDSLSMNRKVEKDEQRDVEDNGKVNYIYYAYCGCSNINSVSIRC